MKTRWRGHNLTVQILFSRTGVATQILVSTDELRLLWDCGDGATRDLIDAGIPPQSLSGAFLSHGHADHIGGLWGLLGYMRAVGRNHRFTVWYPKGSREIEELLGAFQRAHAGDLPYELRGQSLSPRDEVIVGKTRVRAIGVRHRDSVAGVPGALVPAFGYLIEGGSERVAYTGDASPGPGLRELISGVDLALIEATWDRAGPEGLHLSLDEAVELGKLAKRALLIHRPNGRVLWLDEV